MSLRVLPTLFRLDIGSMSNGADWMVGYGTLLQGVCAFLTVVVLGAGFYATWRQLKESEQNTAAQNVLARFEKYQSINDEFEADEEIGRVRTAASEDENACKANRIDVILKGDNLVNVSYDDRYKYMAFYEQLALMIQSKLITEDIAFYIFGFELIQTVFGTAILRTVFGDMLLEGRYNPNFWKDNDSPDDPYWGLFKSFAEDMLAYQTRYPSKFPVKTFSF
jgi:hypothetical protein